ncbi:hypothetical protein [Paenibacillus radicis (ex Xue et al. 2023)]|uniref:Uncharacterized protein n=1 Tax=Paenibacillus radicis (ex Xue et al. 2023) TaxID=2972489 RepID=A0ABT1YPK9_9BACL|nr:hypothetical protein [Paenibacillus radicis (ex Xue et al. 2023)]MCR8635121.1 hypothetical protein [Paenibacillus radicis (ex Xue et al. 2023)]
MNTTILNKYCIDTVGFAVTKIGKITKVANRTIHVDWGFKSMIYINKDFRWIPLSKEEIEKKYKKNKFSADALKRALELGFEIH